MSGVHALYVHVRIYICRSVCSMRVPLVVSMQACLPMICMPGVSLWFLLAGTVWVFSKATVTMIGISTRRKTLLAVLPTSFSFAFSVLLVAVCLLHEKAGHMRLLLRRRTCCTSQCVCTPAMEGTHSTTVERLAPRPSEQTKPYPHILGLKRRAFSRSSRPQ